MGLFDWFSQKKKTPIGYNFTDEERERAQKVKQWKQEMAEKKAELEQTTQELKAKKEQMKLDLEIKKLEQELAEYDEEEEEIEAPEGANPEDVMLTTLLSKVLNNQNQTPAPISTAVTSPTSNDRPTSAGVSYPDEKIKAFLSTVPKGRIRILKTLGDDGIKAQIIGAVPDADADSVARILAQIKAL